MKTYSEFYALLFALVFGQHYEDGIGFVNPTMSHDQMVAVEFVFDKLSTPEKTVLYNRYADGMLFKDIDLKMGVPSGSAYKLYKSALKKLRHPVNKDRMYHGYNGYDIYLATRREKLLPKYAKYTKAAFVTYPIEYMDLPQNALNALKSAGFENVGDVLIPSRKDMLKIKGLGEKSLEYIYGALSRYGFEVNGAGEALKYEVS